MSYDPLQDITQAHGPWTAMAIKLRDGRYTLPPAVDYRLKRILQTAADLVQKPLAQCRVVDLACLEGHYGIEFALHGAEVVGIEGRAASIAKCEFVKRELALDRVQFFQDDVLNLSAKKYGTFDIVVCSGILYHLPDKNAWRLIQSMYETCRGIVIIDTFVALADRVAVEIDGGTYHGHIYREHDDADSPEEKNKKLWASLDNNSSFWFTEPSLMNLLARAGFTSAMEVFNPTMPDMQRDRKTFIAVRGSPVEILSSDPTRDARHNDLPEGLNPRCDPSQIERGRLFKAAKTLLPQPVKNAIKPALRRVGILPPDGTPKFLRDTHKH